MFNKMNNKLLLALLVIFGVILYFAVSTDKSDSSFRDEIVNIDTANVTRIRVETAKKDTFELVKDSGEWMLKTGKTRSEADGQKIEALLAKMSPLKPIRVAGKSKKSWEKFGVNDKAEKIEFMQGDKVLASLYLGKINYEAPKSGQQNPYSRGMQGTMIGYARTNGDDAVYVVDGYLKLSYTGDANSFKKKIVIKTNNKSIDKVTVKSGDTKYALQKSGTAWNIDSQPADSATAVKYINSISHLSGYSFLEKEAVKGIEPVSSIEVQTDDNNTIVVKAYPVDSVTVALVSTQNNGNIIMDKNHKIFDKLFKNKTDFTKKLNKGSTHN